MEEVKQKAFVFDLDGTLANLDHRLPYIENKPKNWGAFNAKVYEDKVIQSVFRVLESLKNDYKIIFLTGREGSDRCMTATVCWITDKLGIPAVYGENLFMRKFKDYRPDTEIKIELMKDFVEPHYEVIGIFDDRASVVKMWRDNGYFVFDVRQTEKEY